MMYAHSATTTVKTMVFTNNSETGFCYNPKVIKSGRCAAFANAVQDCSLKEPLCAGQGFWLLEPLGCGFPLVV